MAFKVSLNGANYVSPSRKQSFSEAIAEEETLKLQPATSSSTEAPQSRPAPVVSGPSQKKSSAPQTKMPSAVDHSHVLESLERSLAHAFSHQSETLRVHEQYLNNEASYAAIFAQLMQQQGDLVAQGTASAQQLEATLRVLQSLSRSLEQFHDHQTATLDVHGQFLRQQAGYAEAFVNLLHNHYGAVLHSNSGNGHNNGSGKGNGHGNGHSQETYEGGNGYHQEAAPHVVPATPGTSDVPAWEETVAEAPASVPSAAAPPAKVTEMLEAPAEPAVAMDVAALGDTLLAIVSDKTGYPAEMLELEMDMEADLGIDSIKRVEILGALQEQVPDLPDVEPDALAELRTLAQVLDYTTDRVTAPATPSAASLAAPQTSDIVDVAVPAKDEGVVSAERDLTGLEDDLLAIVSDKTGYPAEMLELDMDMEADLGIDSIKRVEILGGLQDLHPELPDVEADVLAELRTLGQVVAYMREEGVAVKKA